VAEAEAEVPGPTVMTLFTVMMPLAGKAPKVSILAPKWHRKLTVDGTKIHGVLGARDAH